jgi:hypothetical protein
MTLIMTSGTYRDRSGRTHRIMASPVPLIHKGVEFPWEEHDSLKTWTHDGKYLPNGEEHPSDLVERVTDDTDPCAETYQAYSRNLVVGYLECQFIPGHFVVYVGDKTIVLAAEKFHALFSLVDPND